MNLTIGKKESGATFHWPGGLEAVTQTFAILAKKGYGKSYVASVECEEMLKAGLQVVAIDPTLRTLGYLDYPQSNILALTDDGRQIADEPAAPLTSEVLHESIYGKLTSSQSSILKCAIRHYPKSISREDCAEEAGVSSASSGYSNNISSLRSFGFIDYPQTGFLVAKPLLFID